MGKQYTAPEMEVIVFENNDVIVAAGGPDWNKENTPGAEGWG